jgi:Arc/MetJ-type ribon-helix-helix transcriptional regulator
MYRFQATSGNLGISAVGFSSDMTTLTLDLPKALTAELDAAVEAGWFASQAEAVRAAVRDMISHRKLELLETQQLSDIAWTVNGAANHS